MNIPNWKVGCIGCGNMGGAILKGLTALSGISLLGNDQFPEKISQLDSSIEVCASPIELTRKADIIFLGVKPYMVDDVLAQIQPELNQSKIVISMAAGVTMEQLAKGTGGKCCVVRIMPNTPALVGCGTFALCFEDPNLSVETAQQLEALFRSLGRVIVLPEARFGAFTALIGSGPGYVFYMMDAMVEAGLTLGFARQDAMEMTTWLFEGCGRLARETALSPGVLREQVCSPGGVTVAGTNALDRNAVRGSIVAAIEEAVAKEAAMRNK